MSERDKQDWDSRSEEVQADQRQAYDRMREQCPVAWSDYLQWSVFRHSDVLRIILDHDAFSNAVSRHVSVPNGMDPPEHYQYRALIEPYFSRERVDAFEPSCRRIAARLVAVLLGRRLEVMSELALPFAARIQCAFMGWPESFHQRLIDWNRDNHEATQAGDRPAMAEIAASFQAMVDEMIQSRRAAGVDADEDVTASLINERVKGRALSNAEVASILRNWTVGEIGTISASVGILVEHLARDADLQSRLRRDPAALPPAIDEILRVHGPLVANRRVATRDVEIDGRLIRQGERVSVNWVAANRDPRVFGDAEQVVPERDADNNLLYGAGIHVCPGAGLARMELRVIMQELLVQSAQIQAPGPGETATLAVYPASGFARVPVTLA